MQGSEELKVAIEPLYKGMAIKLSSPLAWHVIYDLNLALSIALLNIHR